MRKDESKMIREKYQELLTKEYSYSLINEVNELKSQCVREQNKEYYFLCDILLIDIYIEHQNLEEALEIAQKDIQNFDSATFKSIYLSYLERIIYIYITKKNFRIAKRYALEKEKYIDKNNSESLNRWYLEMSYIHGEVGELEKAEDDLNHILANHPSDDIRPYVLSNLTKIYIDMKKVNEAMMTLNECMELKLDQEGKVYCDYLLAKICILSNSYNEAIEIFDQMFQKEDINQMTLSIVNEYLELLIQMKLCDKALLVMNKMGIFMNATNDLQIQKAFLRNKVNYFVAIRDTAPISTLLEEIKQLDEKISFEEQKILNESFEDDKNDIVERSITNIIEQVDKLTTLVNCSLSNGGLRDLIADYSSKIRKILPIDSVSFVLFNKVDEPEYLNANEILCIYSKNEKTYEKQLEYSNLQQTIFEMIVNQKEPISLDLNMCNIALKDLFSGKTYLEENINYISAFPFVQDHDVFAVLIFASSSHDLTTQNDTVLLKVAAKLLESKLISSFIRDNLDEALYSLNVLSEQTNCSLVRINNDTLYLTKELIQLLHTKSGTISRNEYKKKIMDADIDTYESAMLQKEGYDIEYRLLVDDKIYPVHEKMSAWQDANKRNTLFVGTIMLLDKECIGKVLGEKEFNKKVNELKANTHKIEFRFSFIRIRGSRSEYDEIKEAFGENPYYLTDGTFVVVLENEVNIKNLEKLIKNYSDRASIIRYPRDMINIDELIKVSKASLDQNNLFFTEDLYKEYLKKISVANEVKKIFTTKMPLLLTFYHSYDDVLWVDVKTQVVGLSDRENVREYLSQDMLVQYDTHTYLEYMKKDVKYSSLLPISNQAIIELYKDQKLKAKKHLYLVIHQVDEMLSQVLDILRQLEISIFVDASMLENMDPYHLSSGLVKGAMITKGMDGQQRNKLLRLASVFNLIIASSYRMNDWKYNIYRSDRTKRLN